MCTSKNARTHIAPTKDLCFLREAPISAQTTHTTSLRWADSTVHTKKVSRHGLEHLPYTPISITTGGRTPTPPKNSQTSPNSQSAHSQMH